MHECRMLLLHRCNVTKHLKLLQNAREGFCLGFFVDNKDECQTNHVTLSPRHCWSWTRDILESKARDLIVLQGRRILWCLNAWFIFKVSFLLFFELRVLVKWVTSEQTRGADLTYSCRHWQFGFWWGEKESSYAAFGMWIDKRWPYERRINQVQTRFQIQHIFYSSG